MSDWYRNVDWSDEIAVDFEKRLSGSRHQKAQNLSLQGLHLIPRHPDVARDLLSRAVAMDDPFETPRAMANLAKAELALGNVDGALSTYEAALERQAKQPNFVAVQPVDYIFVVGIFGRSDRLPVAEPIADALPDEGIFGPDPQIFAAKALVFALAGRDEDARRAAARALPLMADLPDGVALGIDLIELRRRLRELAGEAA